MKTILHIITGLGDGGAEAVLYRLCKQDQTARHKVISLTGAGKYGPLLEASGTSVLCLDMPRGRVTVSGFLRLWRDIRADRPDVVQTWMYHSDLLGGAAARLAGLSNICWGIHHTTLDPAVSPPSTILVAKACARFSRMIPRRILCCAEKSCEIHAELGYDEVRMAVIPNGYDLSVFQPDPAAGEALRTSLGLDAMAPVLGFVARFDPLKDHGTLLAALARLRAQGLRPTCLLVGTGMTADNPTLIEMINASGLGDQVQLLGRRSDIPAVMNALDLHVMSSISEAFPNVLAEAMACGTPCVSTDVGDAAVILGETGCIVPPRDPAALADAIANMLALRGTLGWSERRAAAHQHVADHFSLERMIERYHRAWFTTEIHPR